MNKALLRIIYFPHAGGEFRPRLNPDQETMRMIGPDDHSFA